MELHQGFFEATETVADGHWMHIFPEGLCSLRALVDSTCCQRGVNRQMLPDPGRHQPAAMGYACAQAHGCCSLQLQLSMHLHILFAPVFWIILSFHETAVPSKHRSGNKTSATHDASSCIGYSPLRSAVKSHRGMRLAELVLVRLPAGRRGQAGGRGTADARNRALCAPRNGARALAVA